MLARPRLERGGEEQRLSVLGDFPDDPVDLRLETHVEHPVRLVEDEDANRVEGDEPPLEEVVQATGSLFVSGRYI